MKKLFSWIMAAVALVAVGCTSNVETVSDYTKAVADNSAVVVRFDAYQVLQKSGMYNELVNMAKAELQKAGAPSLIVSMAEDLRNSGIDVQAPMYAYGAMLDNSNGFGAIVAKVHSRAKLDQLVNMIISEAHLSKYEQNGCTIIPVESNVAIAYNDVAVMVGAVETIVNGTHAKNVQDCLVEALNNAASGVAGGSLLPAYEGNDVAACLNTNALIDVVKLALTYNYDAEAAQHLAQLEQLRNSKFDLAMNFAQGSIDVSTKVSNIPNLGYTFTPCTDENLKYVPADAWAVVNLPLDGVMFVKQLKDQLAQNPAIKSELNQQLYSATNGMVRDVQGLMQIAEPLLNSLKGNLTVSLNNVKISKVYDPNYYDYWTGSYGGMRQKEEVNAFAMMNVTNSSIMGFAQNWISMVPEIQQVGSSMYKIEDGGVCGYFGQQDNALFASTPYPLGVVANPATQATWYPQVNGSYGYAVVNMAAVLADAEIRNAIAEELAKEMDLSVYASNQLLNSLNYLLFKVDSPESVTLRLVLQNGQENALAQLVNMVKYEVMNQINRY